MRDRDIIAAHAARRWDDGSENLECLCGWEVDSEQIDFGMGSDVLAQEDAQHAAHVVDMLRQDRTITTIDQLDALPVGTVILDCEGGVMGYGPTGEGDIVWWYDCDPLGAQELPDLPALVLWRPEDGPVSVRHEPIYDWVPTPQSITGRELRGVYCVCGSDDYDEECSTMHDYLIDSIGPAEVDLPALVLRRPEDGDQ